jgi:hypothetical protein
MSVCIIIISRFANGIIAQNKVSVLFVEREQARMLALSGIQIAISQLSPEIDEKEKSDPNKVLQKKYGAYLEHAAHWQSYTLKESTDGIDGTLLVYITNESGKININGLYNQKEKKFVIAAEAKKILTLIGEKLQPFTKSSNVYDSFERFLQQREDKPLDDVSQLLAIESLKLPLFLSKPEKAENNIPAITDIFSIDIQTPPLQALALSQSLAQLFGFKMVTAADEQNNKRIQDVAKKLKPTMDWAKEWEATGAQLLGKPYTEVTPELKALFDQKLELKMFSVIAHATVGTVTQKVYAVIELVTDKDKHESFAIRKIYWI